MFCYECGKQVMDGSAFCSFCGAKFENVVSKNDQQSVTKTSTEYDREAIKIYLNNLLQMENANQVLQHELNRLADEYRYIQNGNYYASYILYDHIKEGPWGDDEFCHLYYDGKDVYIAVTGKYNNVIEVDRYFHETNWIKVDDFEYINKLYHWVRWSGIFSISDTLLKMEIRKRFYASLEEFKSIAPVEFEKNRTRLKQIADSYNRLEKSQEKVDEMEIECTDETQLKVANDLIAEAKDIMSYCGSGDGTNKEDCGALERYYFFDDKAVRADVSIELVTTKQENGKGYIWVKYSADYYDKDDTLISGNGEAYSRWDIEQLDGKWTVTLIDEIP